MSKGTLKLFACGGCGTNIAHRFEKSRDIDAMGFATIDIVYIDTSRSNMRDTIDPKHVYHIEGKDGSGKLRTENADEIKKRCLDILQKFEPADINIVLSSTGGGSGSVIAPSLASELLAMGVPVIAFAVGGADTRKEIENTLNTIKSYEGVSAARKAPMVTFYMQNSSTTPRSVVDKKFEETIFSLACLFSRQNKELDSKDLFNWLHFDKVTSYKPSIASLTITQGTAAASLDTGVNIISVATIGKYDEDTSIVGMPEVQFIGYLDQEENKDFSDTPTHFVISDSLFPEVVKNLNNILVGLRKAEKARLEKNAILSDDDDVQDNGLVL